MSVKLEQDGLYILPHALEGSSYLIVKAVQGGEGWSLIENHGTSFGSDEFKRRATLPPEQLARFVVDAAGTLAQPGSGGTAQQTKYTLANLSLIGYLRDGQFIPTKEGL